MKYLKTILGIVAIIAGLSSVDAVADEVFVCNVDGTLFGKIAWDSKTTTAKVRDFHGKVQDGSVVSVTRMNNGEMRYQMRFKFDTGLFAYRYVEIVMSTPNGVSFEASGFSYKKSDDIEKNNFPVIEKSFGSDRVSCLSL